MIRVAMVSFWHVHANDYKRQAQQHPSTQIVAVWDEDVQRGRRWATELSVPFYENLNELLSQPDIDAIIVDTPTSMHHEVLLAAARAGKHIFTEKVIAPTLHECNAIIKAVEEASVKLTVSLPRLSAGYTQAIQSLIQLNAFGQLTLARVRLSHNGALPNERSPLGWLPEHFFNKELCGGGAMIDLGCHPMYLTRLFLGMPESVSANYGYVTGKEVEDNALVSLHYANGAIGVVEAGFVNPYSPFTIELHGTEGSLLFGTPEEQLQIRSRLFAEGQQWNTITDLPEDTPLPFQQWVKHIEEDTLASENIQAAIDLTTLMEAANRSAQEGHAIKISELTH
ncbi:Gfo/Idh/MocA family protein [Ktedonobacter racemifer]|uniref:Oxidoreductase domain protein n=1 Tax=Ktedonobacter racemifer DSM 44963 TaxID=485913 RepID=D6TPT3_KTERA|nr:Gfo/Idh/MocA family oxidoreductase [Ktedonobacter racemifer]EFH87518.1 oxidoreductase domain protein [Ktedonobacter racemifer DSM 44963]